MKRYDDEERRRAVDLVRRSRRRAGSARGAIAAVAADTGVHPVTLSGWVRQADFADGVPTELTEQHRRIVALEREVAELRRVNAALRAQQAQRTVSALAAVRGSP